jgi:tetratricopeptide (TPR) repeat protein
LLAYAELCVSTLALTPLSDERTENVRPLRLASSQDVADRSTGPWEAAESAVLSAEESIERHEYAEAIAALAGASLAIAPELALRGLLAESWARMSLGQLDAALALLDRARVIAEGTSFGDRDRATVLYRLGCCRFNLSAIPNAVALFTLALELCDRSGLNCDALRARILEERSRCYQRRRDWEAARADVEQALELANGIGDESAVAYAHFQASVIAEREGQWLVARMYAEEAKARYELLGDRLFVHKLLNNLGGINFLLGKPEAAATCLKDSFRIALELENDVGAAYAMSSLAQVQLKSGEPVEAEAHARRALELLGGRLDHLEEVGNAQLVLGRCLLEQARFDEAEQLFHNAEGHFERLSSGSHRCAAWIAQGDLADRRGDKDRAAALYRRAAEALQDFHF